jgi:hypothetical protein
MAGAAHPGNKVMLPRAPTRQKMLQRDVGAQQLFFVAFVIACEQRFTYVAVRINVGVASRHCRGRVTGRQRCAPTARLSRADRP